MFVVETFIIGIPKRLSLAVEPNDRRFSGKFLKNVFRCGDSRSIPHHRRICSAYFSSRSFWPSITRGEISTVGIVAATFAYAGDFGECLYAAQQTPRLAREFGRAGVSFGSFILFGQQVFKLSPALRVPSFLLLLLLIETTYVIASIYKKTLDQVLGIILTGVDDIDLPFVL
ncbi:MAG: hypothetical protein MZU97_03735 [Bacillus subtilis]|nr:hypothetical protein [Bacillus subtilis]